MASLSRTVLIIGTLTASVSLAQAGNKAAFDAPLRDATPDITPIIAKAAEGPVDVSAAVTQPVEERPARGKPAKRLAKARAMRIETALKHRDLARSEANAPVSAEERTVEASIAPAVDQVARLASKSAGIAAENALSTETRAPSVPTPTSASATPAASNTEAAFRGPPPAAKPGGPRERGSETVDDLVTKHAVANGVPVKLAEAVVRIESRGNAHASNAGALGLMQIKFGTARAAGFSGPAMGLFVADTNLRYGMKILGDAYRAAGGNTCGALMRYQSGHLATHMSRANAIYCSRARAIMAGA